MDYAFLRFPQFKDKAVTLSYDDGMTFDEKLISIIDKYGLKCTFNINSGLFADSEGKRRLTKENAYKLYANSNHEVAIHGVNHLSLTAVSREVGTADVINDRVNLEKMFNRVVKGMAYANGAYNDEVVDMLKCCGIKYARTCVATGGFNIPTDWLRLPSTCHHTDPKLMEYVDNFLKDSSCGYFWAERPKLFYLWGHSYEYNDNNNWDILENFCKKVGNRDDIWYCTNGEVYDYVKAFESLEYSADGKIIKNNSNIDIYLKYYGNKLLVKANETVFVK